MPLARTKNDDPTFTKADAYALVGRLSAQWGYITADEGREDVLAREFIEQFDGYDPAAVQRAVTAAIGKSGKFAPTAGEIKTELRALTERRPSERSGYRTYGVSPEYIAWRNKDRELTREAAEKAKNLPLEEFPGTFKRTSVRGEG